MEQVILHDAMGNEYSYPTELTFITRTEVLEQIHRTVPNADFEKMTIKTIIDANYYILKQTNPNLTMNDFNNILNYESEQIGYSNLVEMLGYIIDELFTQKVGEKENANLPHFLVAMREKKAAQAKEATSEVSEPQMEMNNENTPLSTY